jgi:quercetin dioxygenase-like cupin family protein
MKKISYAAIGAIAGAIVTAAVLTAQIPSAPDAVKAGPQFYRATGVDNDRVRVVEYHIKPGEHEPLHSHLAGVAYVISGGTLRTTDADGKMSIGQLKAGEVHWRKDHVVHSVENVGDTELRALIVELKEQKTALALK